MSGVPTTSARRSISLEPRGIATATSQRSAPVSSDSATNLPPGRPTYAAPASIAIIAVCRNTSGGFCRWKVQRRLPVSVSKAATRLSLVRTSTSPSATLGTVTTSAPVCTLHFGLPSRSSAISDPSRPATTASSPSLPTPASSACPAFDRHSVRPLAVVRRADHGAVGRAAQTLPAASTGWKAALALAASAATTRARRAAERRSDRRQLGQRGLRRPRPDAAAAERAHGQRRDRQDGAASHRDARIHQAPSPPSESSFNWTSRRNGLSAASASSACRYAARACAGLSCATSTSPRRSAYSPEK